MTEYRYYMQVKNGMFHWTLDLTPEELDFLQEKHQEKCEACGHLHIFHTSRTDCKICGVGKCPVGAALLE